MKQSHITSDIYGHDEISDKSHSLRYIHIVAKNVVGLLNRVTSLMRRKRYNIEEIDISFDDNNQSHIIVSVNGRLIDTNHLIFMLEKLHDVVSVYDDTNSSIYYNFYVTLGNKEMFKSFPFFPIKFINQTKKVTGIFLIKKKESPFFIKFLKKNKIEYEKRLMSLI